MAKGLASGKIKYTEAELRDRGVGCKVLDVGDAWRQKKYTYSDEAVWAYYTTLMDSFCQLLTDGDGGYDKVMASNCAQVMIDAILIRRAKGGLVMIPRKVKSINASMKTNETVLALVDKADFIEDKTVTENAKLRWVFENMNLAGVEASSAPSSGAYALLLELRENTEQRRDFYKTMWPKLLTKEDTDKSGKLADTGKETIELIDRLLLALPAESEE